VSLAAMLNVDASKTLHMHGDLCIDWAAVYLQQPIHCKKFAVQDTTYGAEMAF